MLQIKRINQNFLLKNKYFLYFNYQNFCDNKAPIGKRNVKSEEDEQIENTVKIIDTVLEISKMRHKFPEDVAAEHLRIGKEYNRQMFIQHNQMVKDLTLKIYLQQDALKALPPDLAKLAAIPDHTPPPRLRPYPLWETPPIEGAFLEDPDEDKDEADNAALETAHYITDKYTTDDEQENITAGGDPQDDEYGKKKSGDSDDDFDSDDAEY